MRSVLFAIAVFLSAAVFFGTSFAQRGNTVNGMVFGVNNRPVYDAFVELLDQFGRVIANTRTDGSGRYFFSNVPRGKFGVRVRTIEPDYEEQTQQEETQNITRSTQGGGVETGAPDMKIMDFRLRVRKEFAGVTGVVFAQDVPPEAKKLFEKAVKELGDKKRKEGLADLKAAIEAYPTYFAALEMLAVEYERIKEYQAAVSLYDAAAKVNPRSYRSWYGLALSLMALRYVNEAQEAINKALTIFASGRDANLLAGVIAFNKKDYVPAEKYLKKAKEASNDQEPDINWYLALIYKNQERYTEASKELKGFLKKMPDAPNAEQIKALITDFDNKSADAKTKKT